MQAMNTFMKKMIDEIMLNPTMTKTEAVAFLQTSTNNISVDQGNAWFDEIGAFFGKIGVVNNGTYAAWRAEVAAEGTDTSYAMVDAICQSLCETPAMYDVNLALRLKSTEDELLKTQTDITSVTDFQALQADTVVVQALEHGIKELRILEGQLSQQIDYLKVQ